MTLDRSPLGLLTEAAKSPAALPPGNYIEVDLVYGERLYVTYRYDADEDPDNVRKVISGSIRAELDAWPCSGAFVVNSSGADKGWGPLLYDVAMEYASIKGGGLAPDRDTVSGDAYKVWEYYLKSRPDVKKKQLDDTENYLTKDNRDNCGQGAAIEAGEDEDREWFDKKNPLSKAYIKKPAKVIAQLKKLGKLRGKGL
jgi:hypothetical protein